MQHAVLNNVARCRVEMLRAFGQAFIGIQVGVVQIGYLQRNTHVIARQLRDE